MKEYIERQKAKEAIAAYCAPIKNSLQASALNELLVQLDVLPAADVVEVDRLSKVGRLMLPNKGCPRGPMGRLGMAGGKTQNKKAILIEELCCMDTFEDVDGNVWRPVQEEVLQEVIEILYKEADTLC